MSRPGAKSAHTKTSKKFVAPVGLRIWSVGHRLAPGRGDIGAPTQQLLDHPPVPVLRRQPPPALSGNLLTAGKGIMRPEKMETKRGNYAGKCGSERSA